MSANALGRSYPCISHDDSKYRIKFRLKTNKGGPGHLLDLSEIHV